MLIAVKTMMDVATYINEYKRRKDIGELKFKLYASICRVQGTQWRSWLRHGATSRKVTGSKPDGIIGILI